MLSLKKNTKRDSKLLIKKEQKEMLSCSKKRVNMIVCKLAV